MKEILKVSEITSLIKYTLEESFNDLKVEGEISNFKRHASGHWYFTLKDRDAQINCTMWKGFNSYVFFTPEDGMKITVNGKINVYPPRGTYQIDVKSMKPAGEGELQAAFERLKLKLDAEGLFSAEYKKTIIRFPKQIGIVTAGDGAALRDMISVAERRYPLAELVLYPSKVQGEGAAAEISRGVEFLNKNTSVDVIIIGRGGGSLEDLWAFNEEVVARAVFASGIPVVSAVGHEIDFTISDFVADMRAPTPTAAMELVTPDANELFAFIDDFSYNISEKIESVFREKKQQLQNITSSYGFRLTHDRVNQKYQNLDNLSFRIHTAVNKKLSNFKSSFELTSSNIEQYNIDKTLKRGFSIVKQDNVTVERATDFDSKKQAIIKFFDNEIEINKHGS